MVVVPKKGGKWRVCVDYMDLNEACSKDNFPLSRIDHIVDASAEHGMFLSMDAFSRYHQIPMHPLDVEKMTFIIPHRLYYYNVMPFGLKNARATYQRLVTKIFRPPMGKTMEVYIDDMLVKSKEHLDHTKHLQETFEFLHTYDMKLNPLKCAFGISSGKFLGFMVTQRRIEANPIQLRAIVESQAPTSRKGVHQLTGRLATLGQFISRFTNRLKSLFTTLKGAKLIGWNKECDQDFMAIKQYLTQPQIMANPKAGDTLYLYIAVSNVLVSATLFKEYENWKHKPVFFVRKSLSEVETRYTLLEQVTLALRVAAKKLCPYFQAHPIVMLTNLPLQSTIHKLDLSRRMA